MPSFLNIFFFFGLLASLVSAAPGVIQKRSFKVERVRNAHFKGYDGPRELFKAYQKYRMDVPPALLDAIHNKGKPDITENSSGSAVGANNGTTPAAGNSTAGVGLVTATPEAGDVEYLSPVQIGGQTLNLDFDSGSSDLWVFNSQLSAKATQGHTVYDPTKSSGFKMINGASFSISYGDGSGAAGNVGTDTVVIGGATVTSQAVELATAVSQSFVDDTSNNGLLGLAFSKLNTVKPQQQKTFFDNVMPSLAEPVFTADLRKNAVGAYEFGRIDSTKFTGNMAWIPVNTTQGFWQFGTSGFSVGTGAAQTVAPAQAIADTGTTLILTSQEVSDGYYSQVQGAVNNAQVGGMTVPCDATLPDLILDVGGIYQARVKGEDINFAQVQGNTCFGGVQPTTSSLQIWGDIFFKSQFVAFNGGNNSLGMAQHV
ncbi:penicillopepsin [Coniochaeta sp. PMI_546]|nr:penicillopepsin [Coniochaeta sp. PMI_546]